MIPPRYMLVYRKKDLPFTSEFEVPSYVLETILAKNKAFEVVTYPFTSNYSFSNLTTLS